MLSFLLLGQTPSIDTPSDFSGVSANRGYALVVRREPPSYDLIKISSILKGHRRMRWKRLSTRALDLLPFRDGFLVCGDRGRLTYFVPGGAPTRFAPEIPAPMPQYPFHKFEIDAKGRPCVWADLGPFMSYGMARFEAGRWTVAVGDVIKGPHKSPPEWFSDETNLTWAADARIRQLSKTESASPIASGLPKVRAFGFSPRDGAEKGGPIVATLQNGRFRIYQAPTLDPNMIDADFGHSCLFLASQSQLCQYTYEGFKVHRLRPYHGQVAR